MGDILRDPGCAAGFHEYQKWDCGCTQWGNVCCRNQQKVAKCELCGHIADRGDVNFIKKRDSTSNAIKSLRYRIKALESKLNEGRATPCHKTYGTVWDLISEIRDNHRRGYSPRMGQVAGLFWLLDEHLVLRKTGGKNGDPGNAGQTVKG